MLVRGKITQKPKPFQVLLPKESFTQVNVGQMVMTDSAELVKKIRELRLEQEYCQQRKCKN